MSCTWEVVPFVGAHCGWPRYSEASEMRLRLRKSRATETAMDPGLQSTEMASVWEMTGGKVCVKGAAGVVVMGRSVEDELVLWTTD